jgi:transcription-repair coupling factor (superfamily II helicase)
MRIGVGHGQMGEAELEKTMLQFMRHEFDICLYHNYRKRPGYSAGQHHDHRERRALRPSELYQLRGRVGRSNRRAYAYLLVPPDTELTEIARKRLAALKEFSDLGAGSRSRRSIWNCAAPATCWAASSTATSTPSGFDTYVGCWRKPCAS